MKRSNNTRTGSAKNAGRGTRLTSSSLLTRCNSSVEWVTLEEADKLQKFHWPLLDDPVVQAFARITAEIIVDTESPVPNRRMYHEYVDYIDVMIMGVLLGDNVRGARADVAIFDEAETIEKRLHGRAAEEAP